MVFRCGNRACVDEVAAVPVWYSLFKRGRYESFCLFKAILRTEFIMKIFNTENWQFVTFIYDWHLAKSM